MPTVRHHGGPTGLDCEIFYETFGDPTHPTLLLVNGLGSQCVNYADDWCRMFAAEGLQVVRYDNRDVGLSSRFADAPVNEHGAAYTLADMAADGMAVLDALGVERAPRGMAVTRSSTRPPCFRSDRGLSLSAVRAARRRRGRCPRPRR